MTHTYILAPYFLAFVAYILRFYGREHAGSKSSPSFILAVVTVVVALSFLFLGIGGFLPAYGDTVFLAVGIVLLVFAIIRWFML
jgi:cytochrome c biogenesis protein CcdA